MKDFVIFKENQACVITTMATVSVKVLSEPTAFKIVDFTLRRIMRTNGLVMSLCQHSYNQTIARHLPSLDLQQFTM